MLTLMSVEHVGIGGFVTTPSKYNLGTMGHRYARSIYDSTFLKIMSGKCTIRTLMTNSIEYSFNKSNFTLIKENQHLYFVGVIFV